jgi:glycosyltransferase involved in cell wall biosynthesis
MNLVLFSHPAFMASQSMPRFARMLQEAYLDRGHKVQVWAPQACVYNWVQQAHLRKWAGYFDQYVLFPLWVRRQLKQQAADTLFVFCDQALGPWVPLVKHRPHVVHAHDLLALRSALGEIPQNPTKFTGRLYQRYIRRGFVQARHFICITARTREDLQRVGGVPASACDVVHNGLNQIFAPLPPSEAHALMRKTGVNVPGQGMLLHVSGNQWYKNVPALLRLYVQYAKSQAQPLPLFLVGVNQDEAVRAAVADLPAQGAVHFLYGIDHATLQAAYSLSRAFLFPSLAEGFGWPIVEAQACGCPVITTDDTPMNEIGGPETRYLPLLRAGDNVQSWAEHGAAVLQQVINTPTAESARRASACVDWSKRFDPAIAINRYLEIYATVLRKAADTLQRLPVKGST